MLRSLRHKLRWADEFAREGFSAVDSWVKHHDPYARTRPTDKAVAAADELRDMRRKHAVLLLDRTAHHTQRLQLLRCWRRWG